MIFLPLATLRSTLRKLVNAAFHGEHWKLSQSCFLKQTWEAFWFLKVTKEPKWKPTSINTSVVSMETSWNIFHSTHLLDPWLFFSPLLYKAILGKMDSEA